MINLKSNISKPLAALATLSFSLLAIAPFKATADSHFPPSVVVKPADLFELARKYAPSPKYDLAHYAYALLDGQSKEAAYRASRKSIVYHDFNEDGVRDFIAVYEENPVLRTSQGEPCDEISYLCQPQYGPRVLEVYLSTSSDSNNPTYQKLLSKTQYIPQGDDGAAGSADPFTGIKMVDRSQNVFSLTFEYSRDDKYTAFFQYRPQISKSKQRRGKKNSSNKEKDFYLIEELMTDGDTTTKYDYIKGIMINEDTGETVELSKGRPLTSLKDHRPEAISEQQ